MRPAVLQANQAEQPRAVRIHVPNSELLSAKTTTKSKKSSLSKAAKKKKSAIKTVKVGEKELTFSHDMRTSFLWSGIIFTLLVVKIVRMAAAGNLRAAFFEEPNYKYIARSDAEEAELHEFCCESCGYTMFPARGREGKFFPDNFKCPNCDAAKEAFFDMTDLSDPRTIEALKEDEDFDYEIEDIVVTLSDEDDAPIDPRAKLTDPQSPPPPLPPSAAGPEPPSAAPPPSSPPPPPPPSAPPSLPPPPPSSEGGADFDPLNNPLI